MAKDSAGRKYNRIEAYDRKVGDKVIHVREHVRSNSNLCKGEKKKWKKVGVAVPKLEKEV